MESFSNLWIGFTHILHWEPLFYCFVGVFLGTLIGVLPGIGPVGTMSLLMPFMYKSSPLLGIIMLAGVYYGAYYGGSTTSILLNIPGEAASVITCLDGHQMAKQGRAGPALGIAAFGSFIAGTVGLVGLTLIAPPLASFALQFGPPEYFSLICMGLAFSISLTSGSMVRSVMMVSFGVILGCIGMDPEHGVVRFGLGIFELMDGISIAPFAMGLFGISEVLINIEEGLGDRSILKTRIKGLFPSLRDWRSSIMPISRGSILGFFLGILPGAGGIISTFVSYALEKKISKHPEEFGKGAIEGVAGPESANNSATAGGFVPMLTLGIPPNAVMALLLGVLIIHGVVPGPQMLSNHSDVFWGLIASMYLGNILLLMLNLPLIGLWVQLVKIPYKILFPIILLICVIGAYSINNSTFDIGVMLIFGMLGYMLRKYKYEGTPIVLAFVLGPMLEDSFRLSLLMSDGSFAIFFTRPIATGVICLTLILLLSSAIPILKKRRRAMSTLEQAS